MTREVVQSDHDFRIRSEQTTLTCFGQKVYDTNVLIEMINSNSTST